MLVTRNIPSSSSNSAFEPSAIASSESLRKRTATSFSSRIVSGGSLGKRTAFSSARTRLPATAVARVSMGR